MPIEDTRLNLNTAPPEQIAKRLPGVGFATAKKIVELRMSLSGERFANLKQLENIPRVNWDQLIEEDLILLVKLEKAEETMLSTKHRLRMEFIL